MPLPPPKPGSPPGLPEGEPSGLFKLAKDLSANKPPIKPKEFGRMDLTEFPQRVDLKNTQTQYFPEGSYLKIPDGSEYILDSTGRTIILFEKPTEKGFTSVYSPLTPGELRRQLARFPEEQQKQLVQLLHLPDLDQENISTRIPSAWERLRVRTEMLKRQPVQHVENGVPSDLPEDHFLKLTQNEYQQRRSQQWASVKDLNDNDPRKIVYLRRFTEEFHSPVRFNPELTVPSSEPYQYYVPDTSRLDEVPNVEPSHPRFDIPAGKKVGFVIGYHHLEKPWGHIFMDMLKQQAQYNPDQVEFIVIKNMAKPTGEESFASDTEIQAAVRQKGITHVIDVHEQLARLDHYMDGHDNPQFREGSRKSGAEAEYTLDPFVPTWMIEQYYQGHIYPQLQYAVNDQLGKVETLIKGIT